MIFKVIAIVALILSIWSVVTLIDLVQAVNILLKIAELRGYLKEKDKCQQ